MTFFLIFVALFLFAGVASAMGWTPDTTSRDWTAGRLLDSPRVRTHPGG